MNRLSQTKLKAVLTPAPSSTRRRKTHPTVVYRCEAMSRRFQANVEKVAFGSVYILDRGGVAQSVVASKLKKKNNYMNHPAHSEVALREVCLH